MKNAIPIIISLLMFSCNLSAQNNLLELKILNTEIPNNQDLLLSFEIVNESDNFVIFPFDTFSLTGYEYYKTIGDVNPEPLYGNTDEDQIKMGVRVINEKGELTECFPHSYPTISPIDFKMNRNRLNKKIKSSKDSIIIDYYKKSGVNKPNDWIFFNDYLLDNIIILNPKETKKFNIIFNLSSFYQKTPLITDLPIEFNIEINKKGYYFYLELDIDAALYKEYQLGDYIDELFGSKYLKDEKYLKFNGKLISNKIPIEYKENE